MGSRKRIVICGGGAIGAAIAYFVSLRGARPIVIERHEVGRRGIRQVGRVFGARLVPVDWHGAASRFMPDFPILGDIGG